MTGHLVLLLLAAAPALAADSWDAVAKILGRAGSLQDGVYKIGLPRTDLKVTVAGVPIQAGLALGSWAAFRQDGGGAAVVVGDLVLLETEVDAVMRQLRADNFLITALHNHVLEESPGVMYMHYFGRGAPEKLATSLKNALAQTGTPLAAPAASAASAAAGAGAWKEVESIIGHPGRAAGAVFQINVARGEPHSMAGVSLAPSMGMATVLNFQMAGERAATTGDFVLLESEVNPVISELLRHNIRVTALHNHMLEDQPRYFFMHFWGLAEKAALARGLRAALDRTHSAAPAGPAAQPASRSWRFDSIAGLTFALTGQGTPGKWEIRDGALAQISTDKTSYRFPLAIADDTSFGDLDLSVRFKAISGEVDQAGGVIFRAQDANNYYVARANVLEGNYRIYHITNGRRQQFGGANFKITPNEWHTLRVVAEGDTFRCYYDGELKITAKDATLPNAGKIGLWTKADSVTYFDDLEVKPPK